MPKLKRNVGLLGATSVGIANIIGAGIFVISGVAAGLAGPSVILSFFLAGIIALLTALSSAELASMITETGAAYAFTKKAFGRVPSFFVGWFKYFDYMAGAAAVSIGFAAYFTALFGLSGPLPLILTAVGLPVFFTVLNVIGVKESANATSIMVVIKLVALTLLIGASGLYLLQFFDIAHFTPLFPNGINGMFNGTAVIFFSFLGFNTIAMMAEETKNPEKTIPRALILAFVVTFILYMAIAVLEIGILNWQDLGTSASPLEDLARAITTNPFFLSFIAFSALIATASVVLSSILGGTRASFAMGRDRLLPQQLDRISKRFCTPYVSVIVGGVFIAALAGLFFNNIDVIASIVNFGSLFTYLFVHASLIKLRHDAPDMHRPFRVPLYPLTPILGAISCILLMLYLSLNAQIMAVIWLLIGICVLVVMTKKTPQWQPSESEEQKGLTRDEETLEGEANGIGECGSERIGD
jgi:APA family basic amino acid/polyamine antiporter